MLTGLLQSTTGLALCDCFEGRGGGSPKDLLTLLTRFHHSGRSDEAAISFFFFFGTVRKRYLLNAQKMAEELVHGVDEACAKLIAFLCESAVPEKSLSRLRKLNADHAAEEILERAEELGCCMPYMRHDILARHLTKGWGAACTYKQLLRKKAFKLCSKLEGDNKVDQDELEEARRKRDDLDRACALAHIKLYKLRVLCKSYDADDDNENLSKTEG